MSRLDRYNRPDTHDRRFAPDAADKQLVRMSGFDTDLYARLRVENAETNDYLVTPPTGYPTA